MLSICTIPDLQVLPRHGSADGMVVLGNQMYDIYTNTAFSRDVTCEKASRIFASTSSG